MIGIGSWWGLSLWVGPAFADHSWVIVCVLALGLLLNGVAFVPFAAIQATGDARTTAYLHLIELVIYVPLLLGCLKVFGLVGAAIAWTVRVGMDLAALLFCAREKYR
jgi:O-antigen/teichoic acid export membrane protein